MPSRMIYMDHAATTPCDPRVVEAMLPYFTTMFGNPGSRNHQFGWDAEAAVDAARTQVAALLKADEKEIIFTSGSTESNNVAIKGAAYMYEKAPAGSGKPRGHVVTCAIEHKAVLDPCKRLQKEGFDVTFLEPGADGLVTADMVRAALREDTILVSIMWANNEIGTINEIPQIGALCHEKGIIFHTDATQWAGKMPVDVERDNIDLLSMSGHKIYGPMAAGRSAGSARARLTSRASSGWARPARSPCRRWTATPPVCSPSAAAWSRKSRPSSTPARSTGTATSGSPT
jgi:cysteine desulfurase